MKTRSIERELSRWSAADGDYIHLAALRKALPRRRWDLYLIGHTASSNGVMRTQPLLGRLRRNAVVVLLSSLRDWLTHYNPGRPDVVEKLMEELRLAQSRYVMNLNLIRAEVRAKHEKRPAIKPAVKPNPGRLKVTSRELWRVW